MKNGKGKRERLDAALQRSEEASWLFGSSVSLLEVALVRKKDTADQAQHDNEEEGAPS